MIDSDSIWDTDNILILYSYMEQQAMEKSSSTQGWALGWNLSLEET